MYEPWHQKLEADAESPVDGFCLPSSGGLEQQKEAQGRRRSVFLSWPVQWRSSQLDLEVMLVVLGNSAGWGPRA